jgi:Dolichyl-phosphate-mannose-protein mannosyltransferase
MTSLPIPAWLKPENGRIGSALGTWLDFARTGVATRFFLLWFVVLYTAFQILSFASLGLNPDLLELYALGLHPAAGYAKHPPLGALMAGGWFAVFPPTDWAFYLLAMANAALGLFATDLIARRYLQGDKRILVLLLLLLTPFYQFHGARFNANATLLSTWPIATYCFLRAFEERRLVWSVAAGIAAALAMLGKYYSIFLIAGFLAAVAASPARTAYLRSLSPWISAAVGVAVLAPHIMWLDANGYASFAYATALHAGVPLGAVLAADAKYIVGSLGYVVLPVAIYWLVVRPDRATIGETAWPADPASRTLVILLAVPLVLPALVAPFIGAELSPLWTMPAWFLLPIVLLRPDRAAVSRVAAIRTTALVIVITVGVLVAAPFLARRYLDEGTKEGREYYRLVSNEVTNAWHLGTALPLRIVMGDRDLVLAVTFYSTDHPDSVPQFDLKNAPWVTPAREVRDGWVAICKADDEECVGEARRRAADKNDVRIVTFSTVARYGDRAGKLGRFMFVLVPPQRTPPPPAR